MSTRLLVLTAVVAATFVWAPLTASLAAEAPKPVTECGGVFFGDAELVGDLDCSAYPDTAVVLVGKGTLFLNGFTLTGNPNLNFDSVVDWYRAFSIRCEKKCTIQGPGAITGGTGGIRGGVQWNEGWDPPDKVVGHVTVNNVAITGHVGAALSVLKKGVISDSTLSNNGAGIELGNGGGAKVVKPSAKVKNTLFEQNMYGVYGAWPYPKIKLSDSHITGSTDWGILADMVKLTSSTVTGSGESAIQASKVVAVDSTIATNCQAPLALPCYDINSCKRPKFKNSTCDGVSFSGGACENISWDICSGD